MMQDDTMRKNPEIGLLVAECIAQWPEVENVLGHVLAMLLETEARAAIAMLSSLASTAAQTAIIEAAAETKLRNDQKEVFDAILMLVRQVGKERHKMAHWCWGSSPQLPDALLLIDPEWKLQFSVDVGGRLPDGTPNRDRIFVVRKSDVEETLKRLIAVRNFAGRITGFLWKRTPEPQRDEYLRLLASEPQVHEAVLRLRRRQKSNRPAPE